MVRVYNVLLNVAEALNDVTRPDETGGMVDSLMAGKNNCIFPPFFSLYNFERITAERRTQGINLNLNLLYLPILC